MKERDHSLVYWKPLHGFLADLDLSIIHAIEVSPAENGGVLFPAC